MQKVLHALLALAQADATKGEPEGSKASLLLIPKVQAVSEGTDVMGSSG
jgi:hypothetical protein